MRHKRSGIIITTLLILSILFMCGCPQKPGPTPTTSIAPTGPIKFGFIGPLSGSAAAYGISQKNGIEIALKELNREGERPIELLHEDSQLDPNKATLALKKLIDVDKVAAVIGESSTSNTLTILPVSDRSKTIVLSPIASGAQLSGASPYFFRVSPSDTFQANVAAKLANEKGWKKAAIIYTDDDWGNGLQKAFAADFARLGGEVALSEGAAADSKDFRTLLTKIKSAKPDFIYLPLHPGSAGPMLVQAVELGLKLPILGTDSFSEPTIVTFAKKAADGVIYVVPSEPAGAEWQGFAEKYKETYKEEPNYNAAAAYDAVKILADVTRKAPALDGDTLRGELLKLKDYHGASGLITFDDQGNVTSKSFTTMTIKDGKSVPYKESK